MVAHTRKPAPFAVARIRCLEAIVAERDRDAGVLLETPLPARAFKK
jgi:hypothetical protein